MCNRDVMLREQRDLVRLDDDAVRSEHARAEQALAREQARSRRPGWIDEPGDRLPRPAAVEEIAHLRLALGDVRRNRQPELRACAVDGRRDAVGRVRGNAEHHPVVEVRRGARAKLFELRQRLVGIGPEHLEIGDAAEPQLVHRHGRRAAEAAVSDRRDPGAQALGGAEPCDRHVLVPTDPALSVSVQPDPLGEVGQRIPEAGIHRVLEVRVRIDERRDDHRVVVKRPPAELVGVADVGDASVLDHYGPVLDRRALDRHDPISGENPVHGPVRLAGSIRAARRSTRTASQIDPSYKMISGMPSITVVTGSMPGSATATQATTK